jgi:thioredoxin reductase
MAITTDAVVVGGGPAGLNAALVLARARRHVLLIDAGEPRNAASHAMHGFLSRDGLDPAELLLLGRSEHMTYSSVEMVSGLVENVTINDGQFDVLSSRGDVVRTRKLLLATGIRDVLPRIAGLAPMYGTSVFHCPYCDGWEVSDEPIGVFGDGPSAFRQALLLLSWSRDVVLCTHGPSELQPEQRAQLVREGIPVCEKRIARVVGRHGQLDRIVFDDGTSLERRALFFHGHTELSSSLPVKMGCALTDAGRIEIDETGRTSVAGVYAAGDGARRAGQHPATQVILAAASGALAAIALHQELMHEDVGLPPVVLGAAPAASPPSAIPHSVGR